MHLNLNAGWVMMKSCESPEVQAGLDFLLCGKAETAAQVQKTKKVSGCCYSSLTLLMQKYFSVIRQRKDNLQAGGGKRIYIYLQKPVKSLVWKAHLAANFRKA